MERHREIWRDIERYGETRGDFDIYIYIERERERERDIKREREREGGICGEI